MISFHPIYQTRVWGGLLLQEKYARALPDSQPYGESWEISDRPEAQSLVSSGPYQGLTLNQLWTEKPELFGPLPPSDRFPLLIKILDARQDLSIQVHPPASRAEELGGEPKTEMWFIAEADPGAKLYVGLREETTPEEFAAALENGTVESLVHALQPKSGDFITIPSGRLHSIGAGFLIFEIQQNSDTTYRVFDWNRNGLDGKPRQLHIPESLASIDFTDLRPEMDQPKGDLISETAYFRVTTHHLHPGETVTLPDPETFAIISVVTGTLTDPDGQTLPSGSFALLPPGCPLATATAPTQILLTQIPR